MEDLEVLESLICDNTDQFNGSSEMGNDKGKQQEENKVTTQTRSKSKKAKKTQKTKKKSKNSVKKSSFIGEYLVEGKLGGGSAGQVVKAVGPEGQWVALKLINRFRNTSTNSTNNNNTNNNSNGDDSMQRINFMREVQSLLVVNGHSNVVSLLDYFETDRFFVMVFPIATTDLLEVLLAKGECFTEAEGREVMRSMANGLAHCHNLGIIHRDVKLENILVTLMEDGKKHYELADFGLSVNITGIVDMHRKQHGDNKMLRKTVGTGSYIAPEVLQSHSMYEGSKADVYSLGICLFACLCGYLPFELACPKRCQDFKKHLCEGGAHEFPDHLSSEAKSLLKGMLEAKPEERMSLDDVINHPWMDDTTGELGLGLGLLPSEGSVDLENSENVVEQ